MGQTLVLVKHSQPIIERNVAPKRWRLSREGRRRCVTLSEKLEPYKPEFMVSSDEPKAVETAGIATEHLGIGMHTRPDLHEHDRTGTPFLDDDSFLRAARAFFENPDRLVWGNETADQAAERFERALQGILEEALGRVTVVVAHGTVISLLVSRHHEIDAYGLWRDLGLPSFCVLTSSFEIERVVRRVV